MSATAATPWRYGNLVAAIATIASCDIALGFTFQLLPILMEMQHIPAWIIGLNTAMGPIGILLAGPILPRIISRFGPKPVAYICVVFIMTALALFKLLPSLYVWFPLRFALGIATGALFTISAPSSTICYTVTQQYVTVWLHGTNSLIDFRLYRLCRETCHSE